MKIHLELTAVEGCSADSCAYDALRRCQASAVTLGDDAHAFCNTFLLGRSHATRKASAGVEACKVSSCRHNVGFECATDAVRREANEERVQCVAFSP